MRILGILGTGLLVIGLLELGWGVRTEFSQSRDTGPIAREPTLPFAGQSALIFTLGLFLVRKAGMLGVLPWWACLGAGVLFGAAGIVLITAAGSMGNARRT
jgi:hypothetical protein